MKDLVYFHSQDLIRFNRLGLKPIGYAENRLRGNRLRNILLVEDSTEYQKIVVRALGHLQVSCASSVEDALQLLGEKSFDLILLDINLPTRTGYSLLSELQSDPERENIPVICLTGNTELTDKVTAFSLGATDYVVKPFDPIELKARVDAKISRLRRSVEKSNVLHTGHLTIDIDMQKVLILDNPEKPREIKLTQTEFKILHCLAKRPGQIFTRDQLLVAVWGTGAAVLDRVIDTHICSIRKKMDLSYQIIKAEPGIGYRFNNVPLNSKKVA